MNNRQTIRLAWDAIQYTQQKLPLGSVNKKTDENKLHYQHALLQLGKLRMHIYNDMYANVKMAIAADLNLNEIILKFQCLSAAYLDYKIGNCLEQSIVAFCYLKSVGIDDVDWCGMLNGDHYFLTINGNVVCDPWANDVYEVGQFQEKQKQSIDIKYADRVYAYRSEVKPYLYGTPQTLFASGHKRKPSIENGKFIRAVTDESTQPVSSRMSGCIL